MQLNGHHFIPALHNLITATGKGFPLLPPFHTNRTAKGIERPCLPRWRIIRQAGNEILRLCMNKCPGHTETEAHFHLVALLPGILQRHAVHICRRRIVIVTGNGRCPRAVLLNLKVALTGVVREFTAVNHLGRTGLSGIPDNRIRPGFDVFRRLNKRCIL